MTAPEQSSLGTLRSPGSVVLGWLGIGLLGVFLADVIWRGSGRSSLVAAGTLLLLAALAWVFLLRPRVVTLDTGLRILNPLREVYIPWSAYTDVDVTDVLRLHAGEWVFRVWALRENKRAQVRSNLRRAAGHEPLRSDSAARSDAAPAGAALSQTAEPQPPEPQRPVSQVAEQLRAHAQRCKAQHDQDRAAAATGDGESHPAPTVRWAPLPLVALGAPVTALVAVALFA